MVNERQNTADLLAAALTNDNEDDFQPSLQNTDALQSLLATAAEEIPEYDEEILLEQEPILPVRQQEVPRGRTRRPPGIPRRQNRPRDNEEKGQRLPSDAKRENVGTVERYSHTNEDGSFTFGYIGEDGSFREETRGVDCITRGKYGYIDPDGKKREFTYVSGLPCDITDEENAGIESQEDNSVREDPISPNDRFRTSPAVQLQDDEIPDSARPRQRPQTNDFASFAPQPQQQPTRIRDPAIRNRPRPGQQTGGALQSLLNIANGDEAQAAQPTPRPQAPRRRPTEAPAVTRPRPQPTRAPQQSSFFESALDSFTLKPAITFDEQSRNNEEKKTLPAQAEGPNGPNFSTELVFDPASGTFKTELRQALPNGDEIRTSDDAAPALGAAPSPVPTPSALPPTARPFTAFAQTTASPRPVTPTQAAARPTSVFEPLTFPSPAPTTPSPAPPASPVTTPAPSPVPTTPRTASPTPNGSFFFQPFPTVGAPRPITAGSPQPQARPQTPQPVQPQANAFPQARPVTGSFINFGGQPTVFGQPSPFQGTTQPQAPFSVFNNARPVASPAPRPVASPAPRPVASPAPRPVASPSPSPAPTPRPASPSPVPASPSPVPASVRPASPSPSPVPQSVTPQVQFGFQPIQQVQSRPQEAPRAPQAAAPRPFQAGPPRPQNVPFTAFASGTPPQLNSGRPQASRPTTFFGQPQLGIPQQQQRPLGIPPQQQQQQQRPLGIPPQLQQGAGRFTPFGRPPPQQQQPQRPSSPFAVFNPAALRGARFF